MIRFPRLAIGSIHPHTCPQPVAWAAMAWFVAGGAQVQHFASRCCHSAQAGGAAATGQSSRHLDTWLMSRELCRASFVRGFGASELAIVDGRFDVAQGEAPVLSRSPQETSSSAAVPLGGSLDTLCDWLAMPRLAVISTTWIAEHGWPARPTADAILIDHVSSDDEFARLAQRVADVWGLPVVGGLERLPRLRAALDALLPGERMDADMCHALAASFGRLADHAALERLTRSQVFSDTRPYVAPSAETSPAAPGGAPAAHSRRVTIAVAYDQAFCCYFPDMLDQFEALGAKVVDFSPLHDEQLPSDVDVVYLGCGDIARHAVTLSQNQCLLASLRKHVFCGKRLYADGGGLAYLCQACRTSNGESVPLVGVWPAIGQAQAGNVRLQPVEVTVAQDNWLAPAGAKLRGYLNPRWQLETDETLTSYLVEPQHRGDLIGRYAALGSRVQLNLAAQFELLRGFISPQIATPALASAPGV